MITSLFVQTIRSFSLFPNFNPSVNFFQKCCFKIKLENYFFFFVEEFKMSHRTVTAETVYLNSLLHTAI